MERAVPRHEVRRSPLRFEEAGTGWAREEGKRGVGRGVTSIDQMAQAYEILWGAFGLPRFFVAMYLRWRYSGSRKGGAVHRKFKARKRGEP